MNTSQLKSRLKELDIDMTYSLHSILEGIETEIAIASKLESKLEYITKKELLTIDSDIDVAKELILIILSNFSNTSTLANNSNDTRVIQGFKKLYSPILKAQVRTGKTKTSPYIKILNLLIKYNVIQKGKNYSTTSKTSNEYKLNQVFFNKGIVGYKLKTDVAKRLSNKDRVSNLNRCISTVLGRNALSNLERIEMPSVEDVKIHLQNKVKEGYINKKGKRLISEGKNPARYKDRKDIVILENYLRDYKYLKEHFNIPIVTGDNAGQRVITKWNLMPSIIRELVKVDGELLTECDYGSLHPNIANRVYRGDNKVNINHDTVSEFLNITRKESKILHLSFLNLRVDDMKRSPLYNYYKVNHLDLLIKVEDDKLRHKTHKITSEKMFTVETQMMSLAVSRLQDEGITSVYVFDCIYCKGSDATIVTEVMNQVAKEFKVLTTV